MQLQTAARARIKTGRMGPNEELMKTLVFRQPNLATISAKVRETLRGHRRVEGSDHEQIQYLAATNHQDEEQDLEALFGPESDDEDVTLEGVAGEPPGDHDAAIPKMHPGDPPQTRLRRMSLHIVLT